MCRSPLGNTEYLPPEKNIRPRVKDLEKRKSDFYSWVVEKLCYNDHKLENKRYEMRAFESSNNIMGSRRTQVYNLRRLKDINIFNNGAKNMGNDI